MSNFGLPLSAGGRPPANAGGTMGLPVGMSLGQLPGSYGSVSQTHPGSTSQSTVGTRAQTAFNVQPQVTVAFRTQNPLPLGIRRKDFLFTFHPEVGARKKVVDPTSNTVTYEKAGLRAVDEDFIDNNRSGSARLGKNISYSRIGNARSATPSGVRIMNIADINQELGAFHPDKYSTTAPRSIDFPDPTKYSDFDQQDLKRASKVVGNISAIHSLILQNFNTEGYATEIPTYTGIYGASERSDVEEQALQLYAILSVPSLVANIFRPLGVYHNRATHDATERFGPVFNSNVSDIISVSKSNHCFMRDIWGIELYPGDQLGFLYIVRHKPARYMVKGSYWWARPTGAPGYDPAKEKTLEISQTEYASLDGSGFRKYAPKPAPGNPSVQGWYYETMGYLSASNHTEIVPIVGPWPPVDADGNSNFLKSASTRDDIQRTGLGELYYNFQRYIYDLVVENELSAKEGETVFPPAYCPIGKVWAAPMHKAFNPSGRTNIVGANSNDSLTPFESVSENDQKFHSIEVELSPFMKNYDL